MRKAKKGAGRALAVFMAAIMILSCASAAFGVLASAAEWQYVEGTTYEPVTLYVRSSSLTSGKTYLLGLQSETGILKLSKGAAPTRSTVTTKSAGETEYYTDQASNVKYNADGKYIVDSTGSTYANYELLFKDNTLYNPALNQYLAYSSKSSAKMNDSAGSYTWTFSSSKLRINSRYLRYTSSTVQLGTTDSNNTVYPYEKVTVYQKTSSGAGGYYKYVGETQFAADKGKAFDDSYIRNQISVLYKTDSSTPDSQCDTLTISSDDITFSWNQTVDTSRVGSYTGTVYACGKALDTITVYVQASESGADGKADPSTSKIEDQFSMTSADDGKMATDKTVRYGTDEYNAFDSYADDEFSVALSALGQSYSVVETEETVGYEKIHPDVVFVIDASGSMRTFTVAGSNVTRAEATAEGLNSAIKELYENDPETRIGIVTYGFGVDRGVYLPLDKYTLPEGQTDYITWGGRYVASSGTSNTNSDLAFDIKKQTKTGTVSSIKTISNNKWPGVASSQDGSWSYNEYKPSELTLIATTAEGISYYGLSDNSSMIYLFSSDKEMPIAYMTKTPGSSSSNGNYTNYYVDDYIKITCTGTRSVSYTLYDYTKQTGKVNLAFESDPYVMATNYLINSNGEVVKPSTHHFTMGIGTFTQSGLQEAENLFAAADDKENRVPALVLISDGVPTVSDTNVTTPHLNQDNGVTVGYGLSTSPVTSQELCDAGLRTIETAISTKQTINDMYADGNGGRDAMFYSIGPGVDYIFGQTILNPTNENITAAAAKTTNVGEDTESGVGVPSDLAKTISDKYSDLDYVDYADWAFLGDMSSDELTEAFKKVVTNLVDIERPVQTITETTEVLGNTSGAMVFTDNIGAGMKINGAPVIRYANVNYAPSTIASAVLEDGSNAAIYSYTGTVTEESTGKKYNLKSMTVMIIDNPDGTQTVKWYIPAELIPIITYDVETETYMAASPVRLIYRVGLTDDAKAEGGKFYTNNTVDLADVDYTPVVGNPYYYNNAEGTDHLMHSTLKTNLNKKDAKTQNITSTDADAHDITVSSDGQVTTELGNNGVIEIDSSKLEITKVWADGNNVLGNRPESIKVQVYRNGYVYGEPITLSESNCTAGKDAKGNDTWKYVIKGLPTGSGFTYTVGEIEIDGYTTDITYSEGSATITNTLPKGELSYELYLVDKDGNPVDTTGNTVSFEDRTVMSDLVTVDTYLGTTTTVDLDELEELLPPGYYIYNPDASFSEKYMGDSSSTGSTASITDTTGTTKVFYPTGAQTGSDGKVTGITNYGDVKVAFAIAKIAINPDVIVVDYGKTILCSPLDNDCGNSVTLLGVGDINGTTYSSEYTTQNGVFRVEDNNVTFSPFSYMSSINRVKYYVSTASDDPAYSQLNSTIAVIPATSMYYEDDFGGSEANGGLYINYTGEWYTVDESGNTTLGQSANTDIYDRQDRGEIGQGNTPYGYDSSYDGCVEFSNGTASKVEGTISLNPITHKPEFDATAEFTFTGTGFDIISRTDLDCGMITVYVTDESGNSVNVPVINKGTGTLYQIPVISFNCADYFDHAYGTFNVKINVNAPTAALKIDSAVFYLDAIRIYDPMGNSTADNAEFDEAHAAYNTDHEANEYVASIRDFILQAGKLDETEQYGAVYVDTVNNEYSDGGLLDDKDYTGEKEEEEEKQTSGADTLAYRELNQSMIKDFELIGPNEEVYLSPGYGIGFIIETTKQPSAVHLEMKIPAPIRTGASLSVYTYGQKDIGNIAINTATEMFYDITKDVKFTEQNGKYRAVVVLENGLPSTDAGEVVSITNLKLTYDDDVIAFDAADESFFSFDSVSDNTAVTSLKASWSLYEDVFESVYTHKMASTPNYEITDIEADDTTSSGKTVTATVKTPKYVEDLVIRDSYGNVIKPVSISSELDESKILTAEYKEAKTWTVTFKVYGVDGSTAGYTIESANGEGEVSTVEFNISNAKVTGISVYSKPNKTSYRIGESFDSEGIVLKVTYSDGTEKLVKSGVTAEDVKFTRAGSYKVKVGYGGLETTVTVKAKYSAIQIIATIFGFGWLFK